MNTPHRPFRGWRPVMNPDVHFLVWAMLAEQAGLGLVWLFGPSSWSSSPQLATVRQVAQWAHPVVGYPMHLWGLGMLAVAVGTLVGINRQRTGRDVNLETVRLACVFGAALFAAFTVGLAASAFDSGLVAASALVTYTVITAVHYRVAKARLFNVPPKTPGSVR